MKPEFKVTVGGQPVPLVQHSVALGLFNPGVAHLTVESEKELAGLVVLTLGYAPEQVYFFTGFVEESTRVDRRQLRLLCRELTGMLNQPFPIALRHPDLNRVLAEISQPTGLRFYTPDEPYTRTAIAHYHHLGGGYYALDNLAAAFEIPRFIWQQQADGRVYVGSWEHSPWAGKPLLRLPPEILQQQGATSSGALPMVPRLRPGSKAQINDKEVFITSVTLKEHIMQISWLADPWSRRLKRQGGA